MADTGNNRVQRFDPLKSGCDTAPTPFAPVGVLSTELTLNQPNAVAAATDLLEEKVYIADTGNNRVVLVRLPSDGPEPVRELMKQRVSARIANPVRVALAGPCREGGLRVAG